MFLKRKCKKALAESTRRGCGGFPPEVRATRQGAFTGGPGVPPGGHGLAREIHHQQKGSEGSIFVTLDADAGAKFSDAASKKVVDLCCHR